MPIEVDIPIEIDDYRKKIVFGLTARQLLWTPAALFVGVVVFYSLVHLGLSYDSTSWFVMLAVTPCLAIGFFRPGGEPFEKWLSRRLRRQLGQNKLYYTADIEWDAPTEKGGYTFVIPKKCPGYCSEAARYIPGGAKTRKQTKERIAAAAKEYRAAKRQANNRHGGGAA